MNTSPRGRVLKAARLDAGRAAVPWGPVEGRRTSTGGRKPVPEEGAESRESAGAPVAPADPKVEVLRADGEIEAIQVSCACGRVHRLDLIEPTRTEAGSPNPGGSRKEGDSP